MARRKKKKKGGLLSFFSKKKKKKRSKRKNSDSFMTGLKVALSIMFLTILVAGGAIGLIYMDRFVNVHQTQNKTLPVNLYYHGQKPEWLQQEWYDVIYSTAGGRELSRSKNLAREIQGRLAQIPWLYNTTVKINSDEIGIISDYRRPVGLVRLGRSRKVYLDIDMTVLDYIPVNSIPVIEISGLASTQVPEPGQQWLAEDAVAAVELLNLLYMADFHFRQERENVTVSSPEKKIPEKPLLNEIESINVSNFAARKSRSAPNIVLTVVDGTKVHWGAAWNQANVYFEADEKDKLARLYQFFMDHHSTLGGAAKYIELRWPQDSIPRPR